MKEIFSVCRDMDNLRNSLEIRSNLGHKNLRNHTCRLPHDIDPMADAERSSIQSQYELLTQDFKAAICRSRKFKAP